MFGPVLLKMVGDVVKRLLTLGAGVLVGYGFWSSADSPVYVDFLATVITTLILTLGYAAFDKWVKPLFAPLLNRDVDPRHRS
jgi:hypothetical protein